MSLQPLLINGEFRTAANPTGSYQSTNPMTGEKLTWAFPYSEWDDIEAVLRAAADAVPSCAPPPANCWLIFSTPTPPASKYGQMPSSKRPILKRGCPRPPA